MLVILLASVVLSLPVKVFGQTSVTESVQESISLPVRTTKPISTTPPQPTSITKPTDSNLVDESYCHQFDFKSCPSSKCQVYSSCPNCLGGFSCHAPGFHKPVGTKYEPPLYPETKIKKIEVNPADGEKKIKVADEKGDVKTIESEVTISVDPEKCQPKPCTVLTLKVEDGKTVINSEGVRAKTLLPVKIEENKISIETEEQSVEVLSPTTVKKKVESLTKTQSNTLTVTSISLDKCNLQGDTVTFCNGVSNVYRIDTVQQNKFLGFLPIQSTISYTLNASNGDTVLKESPWYLKTLQFLFK